MSADKPPPWAPVLAEVNRERGAQHAQWGQQDLPDFIEWGVYLVGSEDACRWWAEHRLSLGQLTYADLLLEEVAEVLELRKLAAEDEDLDARVRAELVQVAAVAVQWIEAIDRRAGK